MSRARTLSATVLAAVWVAGVPVAAAADETPARAWPGQDEMAGPYLVHTWARRDGMPQDSVTAMAQTPDGHLWLTTFGGLVRFDGAKLRTYGGVRAHGTLRVRFTAAAVDTTGRLWLGLQDGGVVYREGERFVRPDQPDAVGSATVWDIAAGPRGVLLASSAGLGLWDGSAWRLEPTDGPGPGVTSVAWAEDGQAWVGSPAGLELRAPDGRRTRVYTSGAELDVLAVRPEPGRGTWFGVGGTLALWDGAQVRVYGPFLDASLPLWDIAVDPRGHLWVASGAGLGDLGASRDVATALAAGTPRPTPQAWTGPGGARSLLVDTEGDLWAGTSGRGLSRFWWQPFALEVPEGGQPDRTVGAVATDVDGTTWAVTACSSIARRRIGPDGVGRLETAYRAALLDGCILALEPDPAGGLWAGIENRVMHLGVTPAGLVEERSIEVTPPPGPRQAAEVLSLAVDAAGALWVGTTGMGALRIGAGGTQHFGRAEGLAGERVNHLALGPRGEVWLGHEGASSRWRAGAIDRFTEAEGHPSGIVRTILVERDGSAWIGTYGGGVGHFADGRWGVLTRANGLFDDALSRILDDGRGRLWMNGNRGLFRVTRADLLDALTDPERPVRSVSFHTSEGNGTGQPAGLRAPDGTLLFPTIDGLVSVPSTDVPPRTPTPVPSIESLSVDGVRLPLDGTAEAAPGPGDVIVDFVAARLRRPELLRFEYRLDGADGPDDAWTPVPFGRTVHVARAGPGAHTFELRAVDEDDRASPRASAVAFTIRPAWHQSVALRVGGAAALLGLLFLLVRRRMQALRAHAAALGREIEQRRQAEQALREEQAQKLQLQEQLDHARRLEAIGRLAGGVAHDFNNLLMIGVTTLELLRAELKAPRESIVGDYLAELKDFTDSATRLTRQLLAFGRRQHLRPVAIDLGDVVQGLQPMLRRLVRSDIALEVQAAPAPVRADQGQLEQAIVNLVANAAQAIDGLGSIRIDIGPITAQAAVERWPDLALTGTHAHLTVTDTGRGIPAEVMPSIFEPFFTTRPGGKGTGLGLASVHGFVQQSQGHIRVWSEEGRGTRFEVFLPAADAPAPARPASAAALDGAGSDRSARRVRTLLLCDDTVAVRERLAETLVAAGYRVLQAEDGAAGLAVLDGADPPVDLLVTDVVMPRMDGPTLARKAREKRPELPAIFITGYAADALAGIPERGTRVLHKPFGPEALLEAIEALLAETPVG